MKELKDTMGQTFKREVVIEFLYLDLDTCDRCQDTEKNLDEAIDIFKSVADCLNYKVAIHKINVNTEELAKQYSFESSPTIRVNDKDILGEIKENPCPACSEINGTDTACRVFNYAGKSYNEPPTAMILEGILKAIYEKNIVSIKKAYTLPTNLKGFYTNTNQQTDACSCGNKGCC